MKKYIKKASTRVLTDYEAHFKVGELDRRIEFIRETLREHKQHPKLYTDEYIDSQYKLLSKSLQSRDEIIRREIKVGRHVS